MEVCVCGGGGIRRWPFSTLLSSVYYNLGFPFGGE